VAWHMGMGGTNGGRAPAVPLSVPIPSPSKVSRASPRHGSNNTQSRQSKTWAMMSVIIELVGSGPDAISSAALLRPSPPPSLLPFPFPLPFSPPLLPRSSILCTVREGYPNIIIRSSSKRKRDRGQTGPITPPLHPSRSYWFTWHNAGFVNCGTVFLHTIQVHFTRWDYVPGRRPIVCLPSHRHGIGAFE
jgi:hypothetical protein